MDQNVQIDQTGKMDKKCGNPRSLEVVGTMENSEHHSSQRAHFEH